MSSYSTYTSAILQPVTGELAYFVEGTTIPSGYLKCDGSVVSQTTYSNLYAKIGLYADGIYLNTMTARTSGTTSSLYAVATTGGNLFVYVGDNRAAATSTNGTTWTARTIGVGLTDDFRALTYGGSVFVAATNVGTMATSTNGVTWTVRTSGTTTSINALIYNGSNLYVYGANGGGLSTSTNAITWTARTSGTTSNILCLTYGNGTFVYGGALGALATSTDAITWTARSIATTNNIVGLAYGKGVFVCGANKEFFTSTDGVTWWGSGVCADTITSLAFTNNQFVAGTNAGNLYVSSTGYEWTARTTSVAISLYGIAANTSTIVVVGSGGQVVSAPIYTYLSASEFLLPTEKNAKQDVSLYIKT